MTIKNIVGILAWMLLAVIVYSTLAPFDMRPRLGTSVNLERFGAFALLAALFALHYPRRMVLVVLCVTAAAIGIELLQLSLADRHARMSDIVVKVAGGVSGVAVAWLVERNRPQLQRLLARSGRNTSS
jgi:VanZ family protein